MLTMTADAATAIHDLTDHPELPDSAGLRIAVDQVSRDLTLTVAPTPAQGDRVIVDETGEARMFLDDDAAKMLGDRTLDAAVGSDGATRFSLLG